MPISYSVWVQIIAGPFKMYLEIFLSAEDIPKAYFFTIATGIYSTNGYQTKTVNGLGKDDKIKINSKIEVLRKYSQKTDYL